MIKDPLEVMEKFNAALGSLEGIATRMQQNEKSANMHFWAAVIVPIVAACISFFAAYKVTTYKVEALEEQCKEIKQELDKDDTAYNELRLKVQGNIYRLDSMEYRYHGKQQKQISGE